MDFRDRLAMDCLSAEAADLYPSSVDLSGRVRPAKEIPRFQNGSRWLALYNIQTDFNPRIPRGNDYAETPLSLCPVGRLLGRCGRMTARTSLERLAGTPDLLYRPFLWNSIDME